MFFSLSRNDPQYPSSLKEIKDPPDPLWCEGEAALLSQGLHVAVVGARECTSYGEKIAFELAQGLARAGVTVVSGMALGIDAAAHRGTLKETGKTIAVLGCGIDIIALRKNRDLQKEVAAKGLVISEYAPGTQATPWTFPQRNRLISGLSRGVVVVEARLKSGALITAEWALQQGKEVFAVPGNLHSPLSEGTNRLIQQGAKLVTRVEDILEELKYPACSRQLTLDSVPASQEESPVLDLLSNGPCHVDELVDRLGIPVEKLSSLLMQLELSGQIGSLPGGQFERKNG